MEKQATLLTWAAMAALLSQSLVFPAMAAANVEDQKNFYPPIVSYPPPAHSSGGGHTNPTPSGGSGSGSYGGTPPANCGSPPKHHSSPSTPTYHSPPSSTKSPNPKKPVSIPAPTIKNPPTTPVVTPGTPGTTAPSPPFPFGPVSPPFTCTYWRNHPALVWGLIGWIGTVGGPALGGTMGGTFGAPNLPGASPNTNLIQALSSTRADGYGDLYREGTAAILNSIAHSKFPYTTTQVRDSFIMALNSNKAAADQARLFRQANEGRTSPKA